MKKLRAFIVDDIPKSRLLLRTIIENHLPELKISEPITVARLLIPFQGFGEGE